jgi:RsiW-degrading membrane proteinase PrsW (M82 family)/ribosomal protein S18 acetylase RimI-like enzyme
MVLLALALAPAIAIIMFILYRDRFNREPPASLFISFFYGVLATIPVLLLEVGAGYFEATGTIQGTIIMAFFGVALVEEAVKFLPLRLYSFTRKSFDEPLDGIVYAVMIGMGFATLENILYVYEHGMQTGFLRMLTAVPGHATFAVIMGYYVGKAKFDYANRIKLLLTGLVLATFFHGLYDACLFLIKKVSDPIAIVLALFALTTYIFALVLSSRLIKQHRLISMGLYKNSPTITIRNATKEDIALIRTLARQIWPATYKKTLPPAQINYMMNLFYTDEALQKQMQAGHRFIIIYNSGIPVGFASFNETEPTIYKLQKIYVVKSQQGRGIGRFVIDKVVRDITPAGATLLRLNVNKYNQAKDFYYKMGFEAIKEEKIDIGNGYFMEDYVMEKNLATENSGTNFIKKNLQSSN